MLSRPQHITEAHELGTFDCGIPTLNEWLSNHALLADRSGSARTYVVLSESGAVAGFFSLAVGQIDIIEVPPRVAKGMGKFPVPVVLLARLAVARQWQGTGVGSAMLREAVLKTLSIAENAGVRALLVHPLDVRAKAFYLKYGFVESPVRDQQLLLLLKDARKTFFG